MYATQHSQARAQQRGIPPLIKEWLDLYGEESYGEDGVMYIYFSRNSIRRLERNYGRAPIRKLSQWLDAYKVVSSTTSAEITIGHRYRRIRRK